MLIELYILPFFAVLLLFLVVLLKKRLLAKIALKNFMRYRKRTILIIIALLVSTTMISSSFILGDTSQSILNSSVYTYYGHYDISIYQPNGAPFNYSVYTDVSQNYSSNSKIAGITPVIIVSNGSAYDLNDTIPQTGINIFGMPLDNKTISAFHYLEWYGKNSEYPPVYIDHTLATVLGTKVGDTLALVVPRMTFKLFILRAIVADDYTGGVMNRDNAFITLASAQSMLSEKGMINYIAVTLNEGVSADPYSITLSNDINATLAPLNMEYHTYISANPLKEEQASSTQSFSGQITSFFFLLGLSTILSGILLIGVIFITLSEERQVDMGVFRAIGMSRGDLILTYFAEGALYAFISSILGAIVAIPLSYFMITTFLNSLNLSNISSELVIVPSHLLISILAGFALSITIIVIASWEITDISIVNTIRRLPEKEQTKNRRIKELLLLFFTGLSAILLLFSGIDLKSLEEASAGLSLLILLAGFIAYRGFRNSLIFSGIGAVYLVLWGIPALLNNIFRHYGWGYVYLFETGIFLIVGSIFIITPNVKRLANILTVHTGNGNRRSIILSSFSYSIKKSVRFGLTIAMFAFIIFAIVTMAMLGAEVSTWSNSHINSVTGGYDLYMASPVSIPSFPYTAYNNTTIKNDVTSFVAFLNKPVNANFNHQIFTFIASAPLPSYPFRNTFFTDNHFTFSSYMKNFSSPEQVWYAVQHNPHYGVVSNSIDSSSSDIKAGSILTINGNFTIIVAGILSDTLMSEIIVSTSAINAINGSAHSSALVKVAPSVNTNLLSLIFKKVFLKYSLIVINLDTLINEFTSVTNRFFELTEVYIGIGLIVSIFGLGIIVFREMLSRTQQIGVLRAIGMSRRDIFKIFILEFSFVALVGIFIGTAMGILLGYKIAAISNFLTFTVPYQTILEIVLISYLATLFVTAWPAHKASGIDVASAVRYTE